MVAHIYNLSYKGRGKGVYREEDAIGDKLW
jgi:hypothetical protein